MPMTISRNATAKSSTFSEKNDMHITAPKNAATASAAPIPQRRFRFLGRLNSLTALYYSKAGKMVTVFSLNSHCDNLYKNLH